MYFYDIHSIGEINNITMLGNNFRRKPGDWPCLSINGGSRAKVSVKNSTIEMSAYPVVDDRKLDNGYYNRVFEASNKNLNPLNVFNQSQQERSIIRTRKEQAKKKMEDLKNALSRNSGYRK